MEKKSKRQNIKEGAIVKIPLSEKRLIFGRLLPGRIGIYDFIIKQDELLPAIDDIIKHNIFLYSMVYDSVIKNGIFEIIGFKELTEDEIKRIPPKFHQDLQNYRNCTIYWFNGGEKKATPEECIGLEPSIIWEAEGLIKRIEDHYLGKKNFNVEYHKVILSEDDPRYKAGPNARWDFEREEFYDPNSIK